MGSGAHDVLEGFGGGVDGAVWDYVRARWEGWMRKFGAKEVNTDGATAGIGNGQVRYVTVGM